MTKYNINTHKFELDGEEYFLKPLGGAHIGLLFEVLEAFQSVNSRIESETPVDATEEEKEKLSGDKFLEYLNKEALTKLHTLTLETLKVSDPQAKEAELEPFVTQNLFKLMNHVIKVNMNSVEN
jgi:hypothetical protein